MIKVSIAENLEEVEKRISAAAKRSGRKREDITLVAVTKTHPAEMMNEAIKLGVTDIGENKPQEVRDKYWRTPWRPRCGQRPCPGQRPEIGRASCRERV